MRSKTMCATALVCAVIAMALPVAPSHLSSGGRYGIVAKGPLLGLRGGRPNAGGREQGAPASDDWHSSGSSSAADSEDRMAERQKLLIAAVEESPHDAYALSELGEFLWEHMGDIDGAEEAFRMAADSNPHDVGALTDLAAFLCEERGDLDEAESFYRYVRERGRQGEREI